MSDEQPQSAPAAEFLDGKPRLRTVALDYPIRLDGREYREIALARMSAAEVITFQQSLRGVGADEIVHWPIFRDAAGAPIPPAVLGALDDDDKLKLDTEAVNFFAPPIPAVAENDTAPPDIGPTG